MANSKQKRRSLHLHLTAAALFKSWNKVWLEMQKLSKMDTVMRVYGIGRSYNVLLLH